VEINQVNFSYSPLEDRLLFRFNTLNKTEFRMWLTRAMGIKMLGQLHRVVKINLWREQPGLAAIAMKTVEEFRREAVLSKADYVQSFSSDAEIFPLGSLPVLVTDIIMDSSEPISVVTFQLVVGQDVCLSLNHDLGISISKLLSDVMDGLDWGLGMSKELPMAGVGFVSEKKMMLH
jgi:hypothetical protein